MKCTKGVAPRIYHTIISQPPVFHRICNSFSSIIGIYCNKFQSAALFPSNKWSLARSNPVHPILTEHQYSLRFRSTSTEFCSSSVFYSSMLSLLISVGTDLPYYFPLKTSTIGCKCLTLSGQLQPLALNLVEICYPSIKIPSSIFSIQEPSQLPPIRIYLNTTPLLCHHPFIFNQHLS